MASFHVTIVHKLTVFNRSLSSSSLLILSFCSFLLFFSVLGKQNINFYITGTTFTSVGAGEDSEVQLWRPGRTSFLFRQVLFTFPLTSLRASALSTLGLHAV